MTISAQRLALQIGMQAQQGVSETPILILIGTVGSAKTAYGETIAGLLCKETQTISCSQIIPEAIGGLPYADLENNVVELLPMGMFKNLMACSPGEGALILDEIADGSRPVQAALHRLITHKEVGTHHLPERTILVGMCNPPDQSTTGGSFSEAMATRACQIPWQPFSTEESGDYLMRYMDGVSKGNSSPKILPEVERLAPDWTKELPHVSKVVSAFRRAKPDCRQHRPKANEMLGDMMLGSSAPAANDRTWLYGTILLGAARSLEKRGVPNAREAGLILLSGCIGEHIATQYFAFEANFDLPDPKDCLGASLSDLLDIAREFGDDSYKVQLIAESTIRLALDKKTGQDYLAAWTFIEMWQKCTGETAGLMTSLKLLLEAFRLPANAKACGGRMPKQVEIFVPALKASGLL